MKMVTCNLAQDEVTHQGLRGGSKKSVQQGRSHFDARSVCGIREHGKMARTPLAAFFNRPTGDIRHVEWPRRDEVRLPDEMFRYSDDSAWKILHRFLRSGTVSAPVCAMPEWRNRQTQGT